MHKRSQYFIGIMMSILVLTFGSLLLLEPAEAAMFNDVKEYSDASKPIIVTKTLGEFKLKLAANPTTGYQWFLKSYDDRLLMPIKQAYQAPEVERVGAGGYDVWTFKVKPAAFLVPQVSEIELVYARANELKDADSTVFYVVSADS